MATELQKLNPNQELFCKLYASDREFFGNGVESYLEAYNLPQEKYNTARTNASKLLTKSNILARIDELLSITLNNEVADKELAFVVLQKADLSSKVAAIREYNRVKKRVDESPKLNLTIGQILLNVEQGNADRLRKEASRQKLSTPHVLLDKKQKRAKDIIPEESRTAGV